MGGRAAQRIEHWKKRLIDLSRRNRLINFRPTRVTSVKIVEELPTEIFRIAAVKHATMSFVSRQDDTNDQTQAYRRRLPQEIEEHHTDRKLQTDLDDERLDSNLLKTYRKATSIQEEHGYNTLFLALGFLQWFEKDAPEDKLRSPILLVPVELSRKSVRTRFRLKATDDDPVINPALAQVLKTEIGFEFPQIPDDLEQFDPERFFDEITKAVREMKNARVTNSIHLGLFSFSKFFMYKDLDVHGDAFARNPLVQLLSGDGEPEPGAPAPTGSDLDKLPLNQVFQVMDADSSQQEAIEAVKKGHSLVIEGPPGTGKSQTITNLVAECLLEGKRILFVSEKMAALRVVYDRLDRVGLGDFCLELHSHKASKKRVLRELGRVLELPQVTGGVGEDLLDQTTKCRDNLNSYAEDLRNPVDPLGLSPFESIGINTVNAKTPEIPLFLRGAGGWSRERLEANKERIHNLAAARERVNPVTEHPFHQCAITDASYERQLKIRSAVEQVMKDHAEVERVTGDLAAELEAKPPQTIEDVKNLVDLAVVIGDSPGIENAVLLDARWEGPDPVVLKIMENGTRLQSLCEDLKQRYEDEILQTEVEPIQQWWLDNGDGFFRFLSPKFWKYRGILKRLRKPDAATGVILKDLERAVKARRCLKNLYDLDGTVFGRRWLGVDSDWNELELVVNWMKRFLPHVIGGRVTTRAYHLAESGWRPPKLPNATMLEKSWQAFKHEIEYKGGDPPLNALRARAEGIVADMNRLKDWSRYQIALSEAGRPDTQEFVRMVIDHPTDLYDAAFDRQFHKSWLEESLPKRDVLQNFNGREQDRLVATFSELDRRVIELNRLRARAQLLSRLPDTSWDSTPGSDLGILMRETKKKRAHAPLRKLFSRIPRALTRVKPCLMMSPLSVAQDLEPTADPFDIVIFDEASQIAPEDAVGAIARGKQVIVVGDSKQLPPTSFFHKELMDPDDEEEDAIPQGDLESVLDECATVFPDRRMLRWHYRSRHEDLIAFSNEAYYENRLNTFPSPSDGEGGLGIDFVKVDGVYDRGGTGVNRIEAEAVAKAVFEQLKKDPKRSVGVGAFNLKQQQAIEDELEKLRREDLSMEEHFDRTREEYTFVKNLETIQGDERDVIFISIGYGRDSTGKMYMNFGPLNQDGGSRRLNVLVTRARRKVVVFSSITPEDIDLSKTQSVGVSNLRRYLDYARRGSEVLNARKELKEKRETPFEDAVHEALLAKGVKIERNVGCSGYKIDMAVVYDDKFILGIECDGTTYQNSATARDRDRLRRQVLESLGWRLHRVWSVEWYRNPDDELKLMMDAINRARTGQPEERPEILLESDGPKTTRMEKIPEEVVPYEILKVKRLGKSEAFYMQRVERLAEVVSEVVAKEGPIHKDETARRVADHWDIPRLGSKILEIIQSAAWRCERDQKLVKKGDFYWPPGMEKPPIRRRTDPDSPREADLIAPEEIAEALILVITKEFRVNEFDLVDRAARVLGFSRTGPRVRDCVHEAVELLRREGRVKGGELIELLK